MEQKKYIHYCWFGGAPLPNLAKKCINSWKKYLPDFEIIEWNESNVDINECPFIKNAYANKKWAFVADYARTKAMYDMGGLYLDTDMKLVKSIDDLLEKGESFLGVEDSHLIACGVWYEEKPNSFLATKMLEFYQGQKTFDMNNLFKVSIPRIMTKILNSEGFDHTLDTIQKLNHNIVIYPRDYFYPLSFNFKSNVFTSNTRMIHYYNASWFSKKERLRIRLNRLFGEKKVNKLVKAIKKVKSVSSKVVKKILYKPAKYFKYAYFNNGKYKKMLQNAFNALDSIEGDYIVMHNPDWLGITSATIELFENRVPCGEFLKKRDMKKIANEIIKKKKKQVIFSAMCLGWKDLAYYLKRKDPSILIKVFFHGSISQVLEPYGWKRNIELIDMCKDGTLSVFGTCKESLVKFYENLGINTQFIMNNIVLNKNINHKEPKNTIIGLYAAKKDDWRKNLFTQIAAVSLIKNATIDIIPMDYEAANFATSLGLKVTGINKAIPRDELLERMSNNTMNLYVTFSECAPMLPIESFEVGTVCLTGNNHHYFKNNELEKYLVINNEASPVEIANKIKLCIENKEKIIKLYDKWKKENDVLSSNSVDNFIKFGMEEK